MEYPDSNYCNRETVHLGIVQGQQGQAQANKVPSVDPNYVIDQLFTANPSTGPKFEIIREAAKYFAKVIVSNVPAGSDRTAAIRKLREAVMTANAGISLGGLSL